MNCFTRLLVKLILTVYLNDDGGYLFEEIYIYILPLASGESFVGGREKR